MVFIFEFYAIIDTKINLFAHKNTLVTFNLHKILYIPIRCTPTTKKTIWYNFLPHTANLLSCFCILFTLKCGLYGGRNIMCTTAAIHIVRRPSNACATAAVH